MCSGVVSSLTFLEILLSLAKVREWSQERKKSQKKEMKWLIDTYCVFLFIFANFQLFAVPWNIWNFWHFTFHDRARKFSIISTPISDFLCKIYFRVILELLDTFIKNPWSKTRRLLRFMMSCKCIWGNISKDIFR